MNDGGVMAPDARERRQRVVTPNTPASGAGGRRYGEPLGARTLPAGILPECESSHETANGFPMRWRLFPIREFDRLTSEWNALNAAAGDLPFMRSEFLVPALREFGSHGEQLATLDSGGAFSVMGILKRRRPGMWETFQPSQLPLGALLLRAGTPVDGVLDSLLHALPGLAVAVALTQQDPGIVTRPDDSALVETLDYIDTATLTVAGSFADYWAGRGKNLRHNVKRQRAKLLEQSVALRLDVIDTPERVAAAIADYGRLESSGWKAQGGTAVGTGNAQGRFYRSVFDSFCRMGTGRIYQYLFDDRVVAMDLCLESGGTLVVLKTTYDETVKMVSPATLMRHEIVRTLFDEGRVRRVEFYGKAMEWHLRWTSDLRTLYHVNRYRWGGMKRLRLALGPAPKRDAAEVAKAGATEAGA
jgi:CelD/BcsL family acetyltransferase involved in cellulose biosynthesis